MAKRKRDYAKEYRARIARGRAKGLSRSQSRGHRKAGEASASTRRATRKLEDHRLQEALRLIRQGRSIGAAAKEIGTSAENLQNQLIESGAVEKRGRRWRVSEKLPRDTMIFSGGRVHHIRVGNYSAASLVGKYMAAVRRFVRYDNDPKHLKPFAKKSVTDINGKLYPFEVRPNVVHRLANTGRTSFEEYYRIVV
jgi:hypothetical protein